MWACTGTVNQAESWGSVLPKTPTAVIHGFVYDYCDAGDGAWPGGVVTRASIKAIDKRLKLWFSVLPANSHHNDLVWLVVVVRWRRLLWCGSGACRHLARPLIRGSGTYDPALSMKHSLTRREPQGQVVRNVVNGTRGKRRS